MPVEYIDRPPRIQPELPVDEIELPPPPEKPDAGQDLATMMLPLISIMGFALVAGSRNPLFMIPMGLTVVVSIIFAIMKTRQQGKEYEEQKQAYEELLAEKRQEMTRSQNAQRIFYHQNYPDVETLYEIASRKEKSRFGSRLWERRTTDVDFGEIRLGIGTRPSTVLYKMDEKNDPGDDDQPRKDAVKLAKDSEFVTDVPITIPLRPYFKDQNENNEDIDTDKREKTPGSKDIAARQSIGIFGANPTNTADFARAIVAHFVTFHSGIDVRLHVIGYPKAEENWSWTEWLPHCNPRDVGIGETYESERPEKLDQLCFSSDKYEVTEFWNRLKRELDQRQLRLQESEEDPLKDAMVSLPLHLVVVDLLGEMPENSPLADVASEMLVDTINTNGPQLGAAILILANEPSKIPSDCQAMIEVASVGPKVVFRYAEVGVNTPRYLGDADLATATDARQMLAAQIRRLDLRRPFGSDLPHLVDVLQMQSIIEERRIETVDKLSIAENWKRSILPENSEWLSAPYGMTSMRDVRNLVFSAKEGGDGVHGMIAGTTGSGKSELLLTLLATMAVKYDPRIVNFVLVDFKGGAAFEPFRELPHCVDILTNLEANAVERMFVAIQAVMAERSHVLAKSGAKDIVEYREKVIPRLRPDDPLPHTFPHLFIIVDEFAEMISANPEYKNQFESVTRLGRAFGVTLILSTQRPAGVVTDQMRANMKFRICLRVETTEDSKELLSRPDAAFLPNMGGRGYLQVGNDILVPTQVARVAGDYSDDRTVVLRDVIWLDDEKIPGESVGEDQPLYSDLEIAEALQMGPGELPTTMLDWIVGITAIRAKRDGVPVQRKPWPDPLPKDLSLTDPIDARYLNTEREISKDLSLVINEPLSEWLANAEEKPIWPKIDWKTISPMVATIGVVDNPHLAEQRLLELQPDEGPIVLFGAAGRGKTTFLKSLMLSLAADRTPNELHMFALDFGRMGLKSIKDVPHLGAAIDASENTRVDQLIRMVRNFVKERQEILEKYNSLEDYNSKNPKNIFPEIVIVIDNFAEFQDSYDYLIQDLITLIRDGRAFGIHFVITAGSTREIPGKLYNLLTQRLTLTQADSMAYSEIAGRGARNFDNFPGRGLMGLVVDDERLPVEFHVGIPGEPDALTDMDVVDGYQAIAQRMERVWFAMGGTRPAAELPRSFDFLQMYSLLEDQDYKQIGDLPIAQKWKHSMKAENQEWLRAPIGLVSSKAVRTMVFSAKAGGDGVHGMVAGTTGSGKSELLLTLIGSMAVEYDPRIVNFVLVDFKGGAAFEPFKKLPHCVDIATNLQGNAVERIFIAIKAELDRRAKLLADGRVSDLVDYRKKVIPNLKPGDKLPDTFPHLFIIVDEFAEMIAENPEYKAQFESITRLGRAFGATLILATQRPAGMVTDQMRANMKFRICLRVETPEDSKELLGRADAARLPALGGRGYIQIGGGQLAELQAAWAGPDYTDTPPDPTYPTEEIVKALDLPEDSKPGLLIDWLVGALAAEAERQDIPTQRKPWPDPLPEILPLNERIDAEYLKSGRTTKANTILINPDVDAWIKNTKNESLWKPWDWNAPLPLQPEFGLVDNPFDAEQQLLSIDITSDPLAVFGSAGRGKTTFLKSLLLSVAATHSPAELNIFMLDFGRGGLKGISKLPHVGASIDASQPERVEQLFRMLQGQMKDRQERLAAFASIEDYNAGKVDDPENMFPSIVVVIDNFAEFMESYEYLAPDLMTMVRDGRSMGIYYIVASGSPNDLRGKMYNLFGQRVTFTMADPMAYLDIVGRGALSLANLPGRGLINIDGQPLEFHVAMPVEESQKDPYMFLSERMEKVWLDQGGKRPAAELPRSITMLDMYSILLGKRVDVIGDIPIAENWKNSMKPENQEWLRAPLGLISSREVRDMVFSAKADGDGVHGVIAGTTGSGKSELLLTLIAAMAVRYDPRIVNFVLVDFKGGAAFEPFKHLPHVVDIATNLQGNAVERIFIAMKAELDRRAKLLADGRVGDLVDYRKKVIPKLKKGDKLPDTFPHLFIIVDEFAEMIMQNPEYKAQFESITRLGRAFGATLILATQRPAGMVTDQMRANMKFRICLRVETAADSKELLKRPDAATLPPLGGRGYIQIGGGPLTELQAAWAGNDYLDEGHDPVYKTKEMLDSLGMSMDNQPSLFIDWIVGAIGAEAKKQKIAEQHKPWPDPLPNLLSMSETVDASYMEGYKPGDEVVINPEVARWMKYTRGAPPWKPVDWAGPQTLEACMGIVDNPYEASQKVMKIDLTDDPLIVFGAAGRGKTTFLRSLILSLAATHSPSDLHIQVLDFGRGGMKALRHLPHIGGIVDANEEERVERLMRMVRYTIDDRQNRLQEYDSLEEYNLANPDRAFPKMLVVIDNIGEFKETFSEYLLELIGLIREGRSFGVYFAVSAPLLGDVPGKLYNILGQRLTFTQVDSFDYTTILGRGWTNINDEPGRGLKLELSKGRPRPLEFHTAVPGGNAEGDIYRDVAQRMQKAWATLVEATPALDAKRAKPIEVLAEGIDLQNVMVPFGKGPIPKAVAVGVNDLDREPTKFELEAKGPHWLVVGPPMTGKTTTIRSLVLALAHAYSPDQVALILVDPSDAGRQFFNYGSGDGHLLSNLPHVLATVSNDAEMDEVVKRLHAEFTEPIKEVLKTQSNGYAPQDNTKRSIIMIFDHYDDVDELNGKGLGTLALSEIGKGENLHFVIGGSQDIMRNSSDKLRKRAESCRYTLVLQDAEALRYMGVRDRFAIKKELPPGRGFMVKAVQASLTQICLPVLDGIDGTSPDEQLGELISGIQKKNRKSAQWSYQAKDLSILDTAIRATTEPSDAGSSYAAPATSAEPSAAMADLEKLLAEQAAMKSKTTGSKGTTAKKKTATKASSSKSSSAKPAAKSKSSSAARKTGTAAKKTTTKK
jgi:S-DNA-T family DNA segregation ATPase FtsK/SpoIIIE